MFILLYPIRAMFNCLILVVWLPIILNTVNCSTLKGVMILSRHGDRNPTDSYPKDPHGDYQWPGGYGALSALGAQQMCQSGSLKAVRYKVLLNETRTYVRSSASERCVDSAQSFLSGMFLTTWKDINVNIWEPSDDEYLIVPGRKCPLFERDFYDSFNLDQEPVAELLNGNENILECIRASTGMSGANLIDILKIEDTLATQANHGFEMPEWAHPVYQAYIKPLAHIAFMQMTSSTLMQVKSGALLNDILHRLEHSTIESNENIIFYSGHDLNLSALMMYLGIINQTVSRPDFGAAFVIELHQDWYLWEDYEIQMFYFKGPFDEHPKSIVIPSCPSPCSFSRFKKLMRTKVVKSYDRDCNE